MSYHTIPNSWNREGGREFGELSEGWVGGGPGEELWERWVGGGVEEGQESFMEEAREERAKEGGKEKDRGCIETGYTL